MSSRSASVVVACLLVVAACTGGASVADDGDEPRSPTASIDASDTDQPPPTDVAAADAATPSTIGPPAPDANTLIWAHDREPPHLHLLAEDNQLLVTSWIWRGLLEGFFGVDATLRYYPQLLEAEPEVTVREDGTMSISYRLRSGLEWSDGEPLTMADAVFTYDMVVGPNGLGAPGARLDMADRSGWDRITSIEATSPTVLDVEFDSFVHDWRALWTDVRVLPAHAFGPDADADDVNIGLRRWRRSSGESLPSSGPLVFDRWVRGDELRLIRNANYVGSRTPTVGNRGVTRVDGVVMKWRSDSEGPFEALTSGDADVILAKPDLTRAERLRDTDDISSVGVPGPLFEHLAMNLLNPHLADGSVREAIALAVDKEALADEVWTAIYGRGSAIGPVGNTFLMPLQPGYVDHQSELHDARVVDARELLAEAGYEAGADGTLAHPERGQLVLRLGTTGGDALRESEQRLLAEQLERIGIRAEVDNVLGSSFFVERIFSGPALAASTSGGIEGDGDLWDLAQFGWVAGVDPLAQAVHYTSGSTDNPYGYANPVFDALVATCRTTVDDEARLDCVNELDRFVTQRSDENPDGLFVIPLGQRPNVLSYSSSRVASAGLVGDNPFGGVLDNIGDFRMR